MESWNSGLIIYSSAIWIAEHVFPVPVPWTINNDLVDESGDNILLKNAGSDEEKKNYLEAIKTVIEPTLTIINSEIGKLGDLKGKISKPIPIE